jgi:hypothetical protein
MHSEWPCKGMAIRDRRNALMFEYQNPNSVADGGTKGDRSIEDQSRRVLTRLCVAASKKGCVNIHISTKVVLRVAGFAWALKQEGQRLWTAMNRGDVC